MEASWHAWVPQVSRGPGLTEALSLGHPQFPALAHHKLVLSKAELRLSSYEILLFRVRNPHLLEAWLPRPQLTEHSKHFWLFLPSHLCVLLRLKIRHLTWPGPQAQV